MEIVRYKLYYNFWDSVLHRTKLEIPDTLKDTKNIFIYFDFECEFGGHDIRIAIDDINHILKLLNEHNLKATWFTVGKIFEKYPEYIKKILKHGHEIGSHTYGHIPPYETSDRILKEDFREFHEKSQNFVKTIGFHSPRGRWAYKMFKHLYKYDFCYDVVGGRKKKPFKPYFLWIAPNKKFLRLQTIGDDWPLFNKKFTETDVLDYFVRQFKKLKPGEIAGIGFHPWVLFSDKNIFVGFTKFLDYLNKQKNVKLGTAYSFTKLIKPDLFQ